MIQADLSSPSLSDRLAVAVVMRREPVTGAMSRWQSERWLLADVLSGERLEQLAPPARPGPLPLEAFAGAAGDAGANHWLYPGLEVELHRDDVEGYRLNLESPRPCFWVMWRPDEARLPDGDAAPLPLIVTLSYQDAGRWLYAQEQVEQVPAPSEVVAWLARYVEAHHRPEPRRRRTAARARTCVASRAAVRRRQAARAGWRRQCCAAGSRSRSAAARTGRAGAASADAGRRAAAHAGLGLQALRRARGRARGAQRRVQEAVHRPALQNAQHLGHHPNRLTGTHLPHRLQLELPRVLRTHLLALHLLTPCRYFQQDQELHFSGATSFRADMQLAHIAHASLALLSCAMIAGHIYMGTVGVRGAYRAMKTGYVEPGWAQEHHLLWYQDIRAGKIPARRSSAARAARQP